MRAAERDRVTRGDLLIVLVILVLAGVLTLLLAPRPGRALTVQVMLDGEIVLSRRLNELKEPMEFDVGEPYPLTLELSADGVRVAETGCPGKDCLHMGTISAAEEQIICLPNRLVATLRGGISPYDAVTG